MRSRKSSLIPLLLSAAIFFVLAAFQNCVVVGAKDGFTAASSSIGGDGFAFQGKPPPGPYVRKYENYGCANVQASSESDGVTVRLTTDNDCTITSEEIPDIELDYREFNSNLFGLRYAIMRTLPDPSQLSNVDFDYILCRAHSGPNATDYMVYKEALTGLIYYQEVKGAYRAGKWVQLSSKRAAMASEPEFLDNEVIATISGTEYLRVELIDSPFVAFSFRGTIRNDKDILADDLSCRVKSDYATGVRPPSFGLGILRGVPGFSIDF